MSSLTVGTINIGQFFNIPVQSQSFINGITPEEGQIFYNSDENFLQIYANGEWITTSVGAGNQLYEFSSHTFLGGTRGEAEGPNFSAITQQYAGAAWVNDYLSSGDHQGYQLWTVPATGTYTIEAGGARGGRDTRYGLADIWGAKIKGNFDLEQGTKVQINIGHGGNQYASPHGNEAGGGGGTYVQDFTNTLVLLVAGGGGGSAGNAYGNSCSRNINDAYGQTTTGSIRTSCQGSYNSATPSVGQGGSGGGGSYWGAGGGGYFGNGANGYTHCSAPVGGKSWSNGGVGGVGNTCYTTGGSGNRGGFGGGGGGNLSGPGGGGGYTGGCSSGSWSSYSQHASGGGSYNGGASQQNTKGGNSGSLGGYAGAGYCTITLNN